MTLACVMRTGALGDNIIASSVLPGLRKRYDAVEVITGGKYHSVFDNNPYASKVSIQPEGETPWGTNRSQWTRWIEEHGRVYDFFVCLSHSCEMLGVLLPMQSQFHWPADMRRKICARSYLELVHDLCNVPYDEIAPNIFPTDEERTLALRTKEKVGARAIGWVISGTRFDKVHPQQSLAVRRVLRETGLPVILFGGPGKDYEIAKAIEQDAKKENLHARLHLALSPDPANPRWAPRRICTQLQTCDVVVGPDTGPMWAVAMHAMPKVLMVSHTSVDNISKHWVNTVTLHADPARVPCWPCHQLHDVPDTCTLNAARNGAACITDISIDALVRAVVQAAQPQGDFLPLMGGSHARVACGV